MDVTFRFGFEEPAVETEESLRSVDAGTPGVGNPALCFRSEGVMITRRMR